MELRTLWRIVALAINPFHKDDNMRFSSGLRAGLIALLALGSASLAPAAYADSGTISIRIYKAGFVIGGSAGSGVLTFQGRRYPLSIGGLSYGFTFGASETRFHGTVSNIRRPGSGRSSCRARTARTGQRKSMSSHTARISTAAPC